MLNTAFIRILPFISMTNNVIHSAQLRNIRKTVFTNFTAFFVLYCLNRYRYNCLNDVPFQPRYIKRPNELIQQKNCKFLEQGCFAHNFVYIHLP